MKPAPAALLGLVAVATASSGPVGVGASAVPQDESDRRLQTSSFTGMQANCVPDASVACDDITTLPLGNPLVIPCGSCVKVTGATTGELDVPGGIDVHGKLVVEDVENATHVNVTTPFVFVQGLLEIKSDREVKPENKRVTITLTGTADAVMTSHDFNTDCAAAGGCNFGPKPFVVAGGRMDVQAFPSTSTSGSTCPTWTKLAAAESGNVGSLSPGQYDPPVVHPAFPECDGQHVFDHYFTDSDNTWTQGEGDEAGATCALSNATGMTVKDRVKTYQGPTIDLTHKSGCILPNVDYLFTAKVKMSKAGVSGPTECKESKTNCLKLENWIMYADESESEEAPQWATQTKGSACDYGEWCDYSATVQFSEADLTSVTFNALALSGPGAGTDISMMHARLTLPDASSYSDTCTELVMNGDAEGNGMHPHPSVPSSDNSRALIVEEEGGNKFYRQVDRNDRWDSIKFPVNKHCAVKNQVYRASARVKIHSPSPVGYEIELRRYDPVDSDSYSDYVLAVCPPQSESDGFVLCEFDTTFPEDIGGGGSYHLRYEVQGGDSDKWVVDIDDFSVAFVKGPVKTIVVPQDVRGCWGAGSELLITSHTLDKDGGQVAVIESVADAGDGKTRITLTDSIIPPTDQTDAFPQMAVEVALLTRNVGIAGAYEAGAPAHQGGYFTIYRTPTEVQTVEGIEFINMGQDTVYRWAVGVRHCESLPGSSVSKNAIIDSNHRCITLQNTHDMDMTDNVGYNHKGHCFATNDGAETGNKILRNLGALTLSTATEMTNGADMEDKSYPSTFFIRGPANYFEGNVAAGSTYFGFWAHVKNDVLGESSHISGNPRKYPFISFKDNVAHSNDNDGFRIQDFMRDDKSLPNCILENISSYRNWDYGIRFYYSMNTGIVGGFFADNEDAAIYMNRAPGITPLADLEICGETPTQRGMALTQGAPGLDCGGSPARGIRVDTYKKYTGYNKTSEWSNIHFEGFDHMSMCHAIKSSPIYFNTDEKWERFDWETLMTNVTVDDSRELQMFACDAESSRNVDDILFVDLDGSFHPNPPADYAGPGIAVSDNAKMKAFAGGPCHSMTGNCMAYCESTCPRTVTYYVDQGETELYKLVVTEVGGAQRTATVDGKSYQYDANGNAANYRKRSFAVSLPAGQYTAQFVDADDQPAWPIWVQELWNDPPLCSGYANPEDITLTTTPLAAGECDNLVRNGNMDGLTDTYLGPWKQTRDKIVPVSPGRGGAGTALKHWKRSRTYAGVGQWIDMRCVEANTYYEDAERPNRYKQYEFTAMVQLWNEDGVTAGTCNPEETSHSSGCPELTFRYEYYNNEAAHDYIKASNYDVRGELVRPVKEGAGEWNMIHGVFSWDNYRGKKNAILWIIEHFNDNMDIIMDDVSITPADDTCDDLVRNGDFKTGDAKYWDTYRQDNHRTLDLVEGADVATDPTDRALRAYGRTYDKATGMSQIMKLGCLLKDEFYVARAKFRIEDADGNLVACKPDHHNSASALDRCPVMRIRSYLRDAADYDDHGTEKTSDGNINVANAVGPTTSTGWNKMVGFYKGTDHEEISEELKMYFYGLDKSYNLIIDDVSFKPHPLMCGTNLVLNPGFEGGDAEFWSFRSKSDRGLLDIVEGSAGPGSKAIRIYNRNEHDHSALHTRLDSRCLQFGQEWEVQAKFKLLNATGGGQDCEVTGGSTGNSGTRCPTVKVSGRVCDSGSEHHATLVNTPLSGVATWDEDAFNDFYTTFPVSADLATCKDLYIELTDVNRDWDVVFDDVSVSLMAEPTPAPVAAPTDPPVTSAPTQEPVPTSMPTSAPTMIGMSCPAPGNKDTVPAGPQSFLIVGQGNLCTLTRVTTVDGVVMAVVPMGRSYNDRDWHTAGGEIASSVLGEWTCHDTQCEIDLPALGAGEEYVLTSYDHTVSDEDQVARFLEGVTFGTKREDLDAWDYAQPTLEDSMAAYVKEQMNEVTTPATSHREYWRKRTNARWTFPQPVAQPAHPCSPGSRWRRAAFSNKDQNRNRWLHYMQVRKVTVNSVEKFMLSVDGQDRTVVSTFQFSNYPDYVFDNPDHQYTICRAYNNVGNQLRLTHPTAGCQSISGGNPAIDFTGLSAQREVPLPDIGTTAATLQAIDTDEGDGNEYFLLEDPIEGGSCNAIGVIDYTDPPVVGVHDHGDGTKHYYAYDPRVDLRQNTPGNALVDGGGQAELATAGKTLCSNAPRTFLNFDSCVLSTEASTCGDVEAPPTPIILNDENIRILHDLTNRERYIYGIKGLRVRQVNANTSEVTYEAPHPCMAGHRSRWLKTAGACPDGPSALGDLTTSVLTNQIRKWGEEQDNPVIRDVYFPQSGVVCSSNDTSVEIELEVDGDCWTHVHPDYLSVYDMTYWTLEHTHPGNLHADCMGHYNPIKKWMDLANSSTLTFPSTYPDEHEFFGHMEGNHSMHGHSSHTGHTHNDSMPMRQRRRRADEMMDMMMDMDMSLCHNMSGNMGMMMDMHSHDHPMTRWEMHRVKFTYVGRMYDTVFFRDLPNEIRLDEVAEYYNATGDVQGSGILVCGSPGEVKNDPTLGDGFDVKSHDDTDTSSNSFYKRQKEITWTMAVLDAKDQLRQRMAWALSQILVVVPAAVVSGDDDTEIFLNYYDIFVRHAFGNYRDCLKEISYSAMMAENLSYLQSKSHAYMREKFNQLAYADENFAREIMQLFSIGLYQLNDDGTFKLDEDGNKILTYLNEDIMNFARGWTGFDYQKKRGNTEEKERSRNRLDPMKIDATWRDKFPKLDLYGGYIGDGYPLCVDLPERMFLRNGAKYRLLGSAILPEKSYSDPQYLNEENNIVKFELDAASKLREELCGTEPTCVPQGNEITLDANLVCTAEECNVDTVRVVQVGPDLYYEYIRPACVEMAFYTDAKKLTWRKKTNEDTMCANPALPVAQEACCTNPFELDDKVAIMHNKYDGERVTYATADDRCANDGNSGTAMCDFDEMSSSIAKIKTGYHWTKSSNTNNCYIDVKVDPVGNIAIVYRVNAFTSKVLHVDDGTLNYFPVAWSEAGYPGKDGADCGVCAALVEGGCRCETTVGESRVFNFVPTAEQALASLHVGSLNVTAALDGYTTDTDAAPGVTVHRKNAGIDIDTVFEVTDSGTGRTLFLRNVKSTVSIPGTSFSFRNSPHFVSLIPTETDVRDAEYETEAILDHYFYQPNTAPFLAIRFIQRFGISNPTPAFVKDVAMAFRSGYFVAPDGTPFGDGKYGNLEATAAAVTLHPEARSVILDADPAHGSLREPLMKIIAVMRNLDFSKTHSNELVQFDTSPGLESTIGQMAHMYPTVFSFFLPEYVPSGRCTSSKFVSPEGMMADMPKIIAMLNGLFSMVKFGFEDKHEGFGANGSPIGYLNYAKATNHTSADMVKDLSTLMTAGRLSAENQAIVATAVDEAITMEGTEAAGLHMAQQLIATTAEFHSTGNIVKKDPAANRDDVPGPSTNATSTASDYKAVVFLMFAGGCDSYNMLFPRNECTARPHPEDANATWTIFDQYQEIRLDVAMTRESLLPIDASTSYQDCTEFGLHPNLPVLQGLYQQGDALFVSNAGVLTRPTDKQNYRKDTVTNLFAHNTMQREGKRVDPYEAFAGSGVMGRMTDVLHAAGIKTSAISIDGASVALVGQPGESPTPNIISRNGVKAFNVDPTTDAAHMREKIGQLNSATTPDSGIMAETWSANLHESLTSNEELMAALEGMTTNVTFPASNSLADQLEMVTKLMQTAQTRDVDRDFFYVQMGGYDTHSMMLSNVANRFVNVNGAIGAFADELRAQGLWDKTVLVEVSDFARTLNPNSGDGTDHAWGGNYFVIGGQVNGGQILGRYPEVYDGAPLNVGRGRMIPTTSWDHIWYGVAEWVGVTHTADPNDTDDMDVVLPNRKNFVEDEMFGADELFNPAAGPVRARERFLRY